MFSTDIERRMKAGNKIITMKAILLLLFILKTSRAYNILAMNTIPTRSHSFLMKGITRALLEAGHKVTFMTEYPETKLIENLTCVDISTVPKLLEGIDVSKMNFEELLIFNNNVTEGIIANQDVQRTLIEKQFDVVITDWFFANPAEAGFAAVQQVPWILLSGPVLQPYLENLMDRPLSISTVPLMMNSAVIPMTFWQRIMNTIWHCRISITYSIDHSQAESQYRRYFEPIAKARGVTLPPFSEAYNNVSILFVNSHTSVDHAKSLPPNIIDIGGYHISEKIPLLPKDIQKLLNASKEGFIYFSLGTVYPSSLLPNKIKTDLVTLFGQLPYTVLWKFEETLENLPKNLHIRPWIQQSSVLSHPNLKVFITHGGLLSTIESLHFGIPIVGIPRFGDQFANLERAEQAGHAIKVDVTDNFTQDLNIAIKKILTNDSYYKRAKEQSRLFHNRPVPPKKLIQHYVELAIETKGAYHLRSKVHLYKWYQYYMLDQFVFFVLILYVLYKIIKIVGYLIVSKIKNIYRVKVKRN